MASTIQRHVAGSVSICGCVRLALLFSVVWLFVQFLILAVAARTGIETSAAIVRDRIVGILPSYAACKMLNWWWGPSLFDMAGDSNALQDDVPGNLGGGDPGIHPGSFGPFPHAPLPSLTSQSAISHHLVSFGITALIGWMRRR